jgi:hypothetical protein
MHVELISFCLRKEFGDKLVVCKLKFFVHASHHANVVVINQVDLFEVEHLGKLPRLVSKEEVSYGLRLERQGGSEFSAAFVLDFFRRSFYATIFIFKFFRLCIEIFKSETEVEKHGLHLHVEKRKVLVLERTGNEFTDALRQLCDAESLTRNFLVDRFRLKATHIRRPLLRAAQVAQV